MMTEKKFMNTWWWRLLQTLYVFAILISFIGLLILQDFGVFNNLGKVLIVFFHAALIGLGASLIRSITYYILEGFSEPVIKSLKISAYLLGGIILLFFVISEFGTTSPKGTPPAPESLGSESCVYQKLIQDYEGLRSRGESEVISFAKTFVNSYNFEDLNQENQKRFIKIRSAMESCNLEY